MLTLMAKFWTVRTFFFAFLAFLLGFFRTFNQKKNIILGYFFAHIYTFIYISYLYN